MTNEWIGIIAGIVFGGIPALVIIGALTLMIVDVFSDDLISSWWTSKCRKWKRSFSEDVRQETKTVRKLKQELAKVRAENAALKQENDEVKMEIEGSRQALDAKLRDLLEAHEQNRTQTR